LCFFKDTRALDCKTVSSALTVRNSSFQICSSGFLLRRAHAVRGACEKSTGRIATPDEQIEIDEFLTVNALLTVLQSKARVSLKKHNSAA